MKVAFDIEQFWPGLMKSFFCVAPIAAGLSVALILMGLLGADHAHDTLFTSLGYATLATFALTFTLVGVMVMLAILSAWRVIAVAVWRVASVPHAASHPAPTVRTQN